MLKSVHIEWNESHLSCVVFAGKSVDRISICRVKGLASARALSYSSYKHRVLCVPEVLKAHDLLQVMGPVRVYLGLPMPRVSSLC